jgi:hypothetical protein
MVPPPTGAEAVSETVEAILTQVRKGVKRFIAVAITSEHLQLHAEVAIALEKRVHLVTASSGAWLSHYPTVRADERTFTLIALGAITAVTRRQLDLLLGARGTARVFTPASALSMAVSGPDEFRAELATSDLIVIAQLEEDGRPEAGMAAADAVAHATHGVLDAARHVDWSCNGIIASGGFTAQRVAATLCDGQMMEPVCMAAPLCPLGRMAGGRWNQLSLIPKGALTGNDATMLRLVEALESQHRYASGPVDAS